LEKHIFLKGDLDNAILPLQGELLNQNFPLAYFYLGHIYERKGDARNAVRHFCYYVTSKGDVPMNIASKADINNYLLEKYATTCR
jgi:hypothetical protein